MHRFALREHTHPEVRTRVGLRGRSGHRRLLGAEAALEVRKVLERVLEEALVDAEVEHVERVVLLERADGPLEALA